MSRSACSAANVVFSIRDFAETQMAKNGRRFGHSWNQLITWRIQKEAKNIHLQTCVLYGNTILCIYIYMLLWNMCGKIWKCFSFFPSFHTKYGMHTLLTLKCLIVMRNEVPEKGPEQDMCVVSSTSQLPYLGTIFDETCDISTSPVASTMRQNIIRSDERYIWVAHVWLIKILKFIPMIYLLYMSHISPGNRCKKEVLSRELTYTSNGKGNPFSQLPLDEICMDMLVPARVAVHEGWKTGRQYCPVSHPGVAVNLEDVRKKGTLRCEDVRRVVFSWWRWSWGEHIWCLMMLSHNNDNDKKHG